MITDVCRCSFVVNKGTFVAFSGTSALIYTRPILLSNFWNTQNDKRRKSALMVVHQLTNGNKSQN